MLPIEIRVRDRGRDIWVFRPMHKLLSILGLFPCLLRRRTVKTPANEIERGSRDPSIIIWEVAPVRKHDPALKEIMPPAIGMDDQPTLLYRVISKVLCP